MTKGQDWAKITYLRATIKSRRTKIVKDKNGRTKGGIALDDETIKKYQEQLDVLESKMAKDKEKMTTNERVDNAAEQVIANADVNADKIIEWCCGGDSVWSYHDTHGSRESNFAPLTN